MPRKTLIFSADKAFTSVLEDFLILEGFDVDISYSLQGTKDALAKRKYSVVFIDTSISNKQYISLIYELRKINTDEFLPIIVISAMHSQVGDEPSCHAFLIMDWIEKPFTLKKLGNSLHHVLELANNDKFEILHIEDDDEIIRLVSVMLDGFATVKPVTTFHEAAYISNSRKFDFVILDLYLPDGKGEDLLQSLQGKLSASPPIIILSGKSFDPKVARPQLATFLPSSRIHSDLYATICPLLESIKL